MAAEGSPDGKRKDHEHSRIFISYRRDDTAGYAGTLERTLRGRFGKERVFKDLSDLRGGDLFAERIACEIAGSSVLIVLIGARWLTVANEQGVRRIDEPADFVSAEIQAAIKARLRIIPVLVQGARMPQSKDLPDLIRGLAERQAIELSDSRWEFDVGRLVDTIEPPRNWRPHIVAVGAIVLAAAIAAWWSTGLSLPGSYVCDSGGKAFPNCRIEETREGLRLLFDGPGHGVDNLVDTYGGPVDSAHCGFTSILTNDFAANGGNPQHLRSRLEMECQGAGTLAGSWVFDGGITRSFRMVRAAKK